MPDRHIANRTIENAQLIFKNFEGKEREFNSAGDRNFGIRLDPKLAEEMKAEGWNIKYLKPRTADGDEEPQPWIKVTVNYKKGRPPRVVMMSSKGRQDLGADEVSVLDWADLKEVDVVLNPYPWDVNGNSGVKAYLKTIFVKLNEDDLELKYAMDDALAGQSPNEDG